MRGNRFTVGGGGSSEGVVEKRLRKEEEVHLLIYRFNERRNKETVEKNQNRLICSSICIY